MLFDGTQNFRSLTNAQIDAEVPYFVEILLLGSYMRISSKGQVTIPARIREQAGLLPHTEVQFEFDGRAVWIFRANARKRKGPGSRLIAHLRGRGDVDMSTEAIMALTRG